MTDRPLRIAIIGPGRMGQQVALLAEARGMAIVASLGRDDLARRGSDTTEGLAEADVAVEFTTPDSAAANIRTCVEAGCPVVTGTTGWLDELPAVVELVTRHGGALFWAPNFSVGAAAMTELARHAGALFSRADDFDTHLVETHHTGKRDAPSGTALAIESSLAEGLGRATPTTSIRTGRVPGTHELVIDGAYEQLVLRHEARDRRVFADGPSGQRSGSWAGLASTP